MKRKRKPTPSRYDSKVHLKKAPVEDSVHAIAETLKSINRDSRDEKINRDPATHEFFRAPDNGDIVDLGISEMSFETVATLLQARLKAQGYVLYFDQKVLRETLNYGLARLEGFAQE